MGSPALVDKIEIQVLVDNATDSLSTIPAHAESEFTYLERHGMRELSGDSLCCACHGLSLLITATRGARRHTVLFDSGPEEYAFERNAGRLGIDLGIVESVVLSHAHWDHVGGMLKALDLVRSRNGGRSIPYYAHLGMFRSRARRLPNGDLMPMKDVPGIEALTAHGAQVTCTGEPQVFLDDMFQLSGEIPLTQAACRSQSSRCRSGLPWSSVYRASMVARAQQPRTEHPVGQPHASNWISAATGKRRAIFASGADRRPTCRYHEKCAISSLLELSSHLFELGVFRSSVAHFYSL